MIHRINAPRIHGGSVGALVAKAACAAMARSKNPSEVSYVFSFSAIDMVFCGHHRQRKRGRLCGGQRTEPPVPSTRLFRHLKTPALFRLEGSAISPPRSEPAIAAWRRSRPPPASRTSSCLYGIFLPNLVRTTVLTHDLLQLGSSGDCWLEERFSRLRSAGRPGVNLSHGGDRRFDSARERHPAKPPFGHVTFVAFCLASSLVPSFGRTEVH
jgi:hypothetical protein